MSLAMAESQWIPAGEGVWLPGLQDGQSPGEEQLLGTCASSRAVPRLTTCPLSPWCPHQAWLSSRADELGEVPEQEAAAMELWLKIRRSAAEPRGKHKV